MKAGTPGGPAFDGAAGSGYPAYTSTTFKRAPKAAGKRASGKDIFGAGASGSAPDDGGDTGAASVST